MAGSRDRVRVLPDQRVDVLDWEAMQLNARSEARSMLAALLFGDNTLAAELVKIVEGFEVTAQGTPDATIDIAAGAAIGAELRADGDREYGVLFGREVQTSQTLDFMGQPNNTYGIYVRFAATPGTQSARVFWDADSSAETTDIVETRDVVDWDVVYSTTSPGDEYVKVADVVWGGSTITTGDITDTRDLMFEGKVDDSYAQQWGDGGSDRDSDRAANGVHDLATWVQAVRRQLADITGTAWYTDVPVGLNTHIADGADPHGATLTQTSLDVTNLNEADGIALKASSGSTGMVAREIINPVQIKYGVDSNQGITGSGANTESSAALIDTAGGGTRMGVRVDTTSISGKLISLVPLRLDGMHPQGDITAVQIEYINVLAYVDDNGGTSITMDIKLLETNIDGGSAGNFSVKTTWNVVEGTTPSGQHNYKNLTPVTGVDMATYYYMLQIEFDETSATAGAEIDVVYIELGYRKAALATVSRTASL